MFLIEFKSTFDAKTLRLAAYPDDVVVAGATFTAAALDFDAITLNQEEGSGSIKIKLPCDSEAAQSLFQSDTSFTVKIINYDNFTQSVVYDGIVKSSVMTSNHVELNCYPSTASTAATVPSTVYSAYCQHSLYSEINGNKAGCGAIRDRFRFTSKVLAAIGTQLTIEPTGGTLGSGLSITADLLQDSRITAANGASRTVVSNSGWVMQMSDIVENVIAVGSTVSIQLGCNKRKDGHCSGRFSNVINFYGFTKIPGQNPFTTALR